MRVERLSAHLNVRLLRVERLLPPFPAVSLDDVFYSSGLVDRVTRTVREHSCDVPILGVSDRKESLSKASPSEDSPTEDNPNDESDWLI